MSGFLQFNDPLPPEEEMQALVLVRKDPTLAQIIIPMSPFQPFSIFSNIFGSDITQKFSDTVWFQSWHVLIRIGPYYWHGILVSR